MDFNGDGTVNDLLPGTRVNQFNRGRGHQELSRLVDSYNGEFALKTTLAGQKAPLLKLPADYSFNDNFFTQDLRLSHTVPLGSERARLIMFGEVFSLVNTANLIQLAATSLVSCSSAGLARDLVKSSAPAAHELFS
jgi:hypothetical protein